MSLKNKNIHSQGRQIVLNTYEYMRRERDEGGFIIHYSKLQERAAEAAGVSSKSVQRIMKEAANNPVGRKFISPRKTLNKPSPKSTCDEWDERIIRNVIYSLTIVQKQTPNMADIMKAVQNVGVELTGKLTNFRRIVKKLGYRWRDTVDARRILVESSDVRLKRTAFLRKLIKFRKEGKNIVYSDETYMHSSPFPIGPRVIIIHCGGIKGFVPNAQLIFESGQKTAEDCMNHASYKNWIEQKLLPNLEPNSVLVIDNASYHNVLSEPTPTPDWLKSDIQKWLTARQISFDFSETKPELYAKIKMNKLIRKNFVIDALLKSAGHEVLRLPPYHPELNPIEKLWTLIKNHVAECNTSFRLDDVRKLAEEKLNSVEVEELARICGYVEKIEEEYLEREYMTDDVHEQILVKDEISSDNDDSDFCISSDEEN